MKKMSIVAGVIACMTSSGVLASELDEILDQIKVGSLICDSARSYNDTVVIDMKNELAALKGQRDRVPYPSDCRTVTDTALNVSLKEISGGQAFAIHGDKVVYTSKNNLVLGKKSAAVENEKDQCRKKVMGEYCLGGSIHGLPKPAVSDDGTLMYLHGGKKVVLMTVDERIASVSVFYPDPSWLHYRNLLSNLNEKYGRGFNEDVFPDYAKNDTSKATSIALKKGRALTYWIQTGWTLSYAWASDSWSVLEYKHHELGELLRKEELSRL